MSNCTVFFGPTLTKPLIIYTRILVCVWFIDGWVWLINWWVGLTVFYTQATMVVILHVVLSPTIHHTYVHSYGCHRLQTAMCTGLNMYESVCICVCMQWKVWSGIRDVGHNWVQLCVGTVLALLWLLLTFLVNRDRCPR